MLLFSIGGHLIDVKFRGLFVRPYLILGHIESDSHRHVDPDPDLLLYP